MCSCPDHSSHERAISQHDKRLDAHGEEIDNLRECVARYVPYQQTVVEPDKTERLVSALSKATSLAQVRDAAKTILRG